MREFQYLGRILQDDDDDTKNIVLQIMRARRQYNLITQILKWEGSSAKTMAKFYLAVVQSVLLYGTDSWTITKRNWGCLKCFHSQVLRYMTGKHIRKAADGTWSYPNHNLLEQECKLFLIQTYVERRRGTLWKYLQENPEELLAEVVTMTAPSKHVNKVLWWQQPYITKEEMQDL